MFANCFHSNSSLFSIPRASFPCSPCWLTANGKEGPETEKLLTKWQEHPGMRAAGDDHISPNKLNCLSKSSEIQYNPFSLGSPVVFWPSATECVVGENRKRKAPQIFWEYLTDALKSFLSPIDSFSFPVRTDVVLESEAHSLLQVPIWGLLSCLIPPGFYYKGL